MPRKRTTTVTLKLDARDPVAWSRADEVIAAIAAVPGVSRVEATTRSDYYMDLHLAIQLNAYTKRELRKLYDNVSRVAEKSALRLGGRQCTLNDMF